MIKLLNNNMLELCPQCGQNYERIRLQFGQVLIMSKSTQLKTPSNSRGLDPKWSNSTTLCRGSNSTPSEIEKGESV